MSSFKMRAHTRNNILEIFADRASIQLDPVYQRIGAIWDHRKKRLFIDSIINGFDIPKIYLHEFAPPREIGGNRYKYAIIDGKQRLLAIREFMTNDLTLADDFVLFDDESVQAGGLTYEDLAMVHPNLRARFDRTDLSIVLMQTDDDDLVETLFSRLNEQVGLSAAEYRNTLGGPLPPAFRRLQQHPFFATRLPFDNDRYRYLDISAKFVFIVFRDGFVSTKKNELDNFVRDFKKASETAVPWASTEAVAALVKRTEKILDDMGEFFGDRDRLLTSIGWITLIFHIFRLLEGHKPTRLRRSQFVQFGEDISATRLVLRRITRGEEIATPRPDPVIQQFLNLGQSSNDASAILGRYRIVRSYLIERFDVVVPEADQGLLGRQAKLPA